MGTHGVVVYYESIMLDQSELTKLFQFDVADAEFDAVYEELRKNCGNNSDEDGEKCESEGSEHDFQIIDRCSEGGVTILVDLVESSQDEDQVWVPPFASSKKKR